MTAALWWAVLTLWGSGAASGRGPASSRITVLPADATDSADAIPEHGRCQAIALPFCLDMPYNRTIMPNLLGHATQEEAGRMVHHMMPLVKVNCSQDFQLFLCSLYVPLCTILDEPVPPCRGLCLSARTNCEKTMKTYGTPWPEDLECSRFPERKPGVVCFFKNDTDSNGQRGPMTIRPPVEFRPGTSVGRARPPPGARDHGFVCPVQLKVPKSLEYSLRVGDNVEKDCAAPCDAMFFTEKQRRFARGWVGAWGAACAVSCLFTVLTFLIDPERFRYPERPIIFLSLCYMFVAAAYAAGWISGESISCRDPFPPSVQITPLKMVSTVTQGTKHEACTIIFMVLYFFGMASSIWWVVLTLTWFLAAGLKWGHEAIEANSQYFHLAAWAVPAVKTISILAMGKVDGDILSGVCYVGVWDAEALRGFVLAPLCVYLALGTVFLLAGFVSLFRIRTVMKHDGTKTDKLEKLMIRIGVFSVLYTVPALIVLSCLFYEQAYMNSWMVTWHRDICDRKPYSIPCPVGNKARGPINRPIFEVFMIKYLMAMIVGITSSFWIWSGKTIVSWRQFFDKIQGRRVESYV